MSSVGGGDTNKSAKTQIDQNDLEYDEDDIQIEESPCGRETSQPSIKGATSAEDINEGIKFLLKLLTFY